MWRSAPTPASTAVRCATPSSNDGVKLDNLIQIAHNVLVGRHTAMAACVGHRRQHAHRRALHLRRPGRHRRPSADRRPCACRRGRGDHALDPRAGPLRRRLPLRRQSHLGKERGHLAPAARPARPTARAGEQEQHDDGHPPDPEAPAASLPVAAGRPRARIRSRQAPGGAEERDHQRTLLRRPLPVAPGDARRADPRGAWRRRRRCCRWRAPASRSTRRRWSTSRRSTTRASSARSSRATSCGSRSRCCACARACSASPARAMVGTELAAEAEMMCAIRRVP